MRSNAVDRLSIWAVRYALGRMSYAVADITETLIDNKDLLLPTTKAIIIRDIEQAQKENRLGMEMDAKQWLKLQEALKY